MTAGMWDYWSYGGPVEWIVVALSAYELMLGLLEEQLDSLGDREWGERRR